MWVRLLSLEGIITTAIASVESTMKQPLAFLRRLLVISVFGCLGVVALGYILLRISEDRTELRSVPTVVSDLLYVNNGHESQKLDLYISRGREAAPLIVYLHGGAWRAGSRKNPPNLFLLHEGFSIASVDYRLAPQHVFPIQLRDCKAAVRWLRANAKRLGINAERIGVWGESAGGHLASLLGTSGDVPNFESVGEYRHVSSRVNAVVDWYGPVDLVKLAEYRLSAKIVRNEEELSINGLLGGSISENADRAVEANPIAHITVDASPFLIIHGGADAVVPLAQSEILYRALRQAGIEAKLLIVDGGAHGGAVFNSPAIRETIVRFYRKHLSDPVSLGE